MAAIFGENLVILKCFLKLSYLMLFLSSSFCPIAIKSISYIIKLPTIKSGKIISKSSIKCLKVASVEYLHLLLQTFLFGFCSQVNKLFISFYCYQAHFL
jgi:hypothetical protein